VSNDFHSDWSAYCPDFLQDKPEDFGRQVLMIGKFDIFMKLPDGQPIWIKAVESLEEAKRQLGQIAVETPGEYFIFNARNGRIVPA
jgi:hypothetical protein